MSYYVRGSTGGEEHSVSGSSTDEAGRRCALGFNPGNHEPTEKIKLFCAGAMRAVIDERERILEDHTERQREVNRSDTLLSESEVDAFEDSMRCFATALDHLEAAQMVAVKGLHTKANAGIRADKQIGA